MKRATFQYLNEKHYAALKAEAVDRFVFLTKNLYTANKGS